jgi:hypothetical protein
LKLFSLPGSRSIPVIQNSWIRKNIYGSGTLVSPLISFDIIIFMFRAEDLVERPAAIERFIMELLADPEPPPVSRPAVFFFVFRYRYMSGISKMLAVFIGSGQQF